MLIVITMKSTVYISSSELKSETELSSEPASLITRVLYSLSTFLAVQAHTEFSTYLLFPFASTLVVWRQTAERERRDMGSGERIL